MDTERKRIMKLVEDGVISAEEAITLLEALNKKGADQAQSQATSQEQSNVVPLPPKHEESQSSSQHQQQTHSQQHQQQSKTTGFEDLFGKDFLSL
ncbi:MAG: hypothetical protein GX072_15010, partial [Lysinibacillus sp.]|nr:hypothetical protein [Lysinibacillus sp.]